MTTLRSGRKVNAHGADLPLFDPARQGDENGVMDQVASVLGRLTVDGRRESVAALLVAAGLRPNLPADVDVAVMRERQIVIGDAYRYLDLWCEVPGWGVVVVEAKTRLACWSAYGEQQVRDYAGWLAERTRDEIEGHAVVIVLTPGKVVPPSVPADVGARVDVRSASWAGWAQRLGPVWTSTTSAVDAVLGRELMGMIKNRLGAAALEAAPGDAVAALAQAARARPAAVALDRFLACLDEELAAAGLGSVEVAEVEDAAPWDDRSWPYVSWAPPVEVAGHDGSVALFLSPDLTTWTLFAGAGGLAPASAAWAEPAVAGAPVRGLRLARAWWSVVTFPADGAEALAAHPSLDPDGPDDEAGIAVALSVPDSLDRFGTEELAWLVGETRERALPMLAAMVRATLPPGAPEIDDAVVLATLRADVWRPCLPGPLAAMLHGGEDAVALPGIEAFAVAWWWARMVDEDGAWRVERGARQRQTVPLLARKEADGRRNYTGLDGAGLCCGASLVAPRGGAKKTTCRVCGTSYWWGKDVQRR